METTGMFRANARYIRRSSYLTSNPVTALPISIRWVSDVPSKIVKLSGLGACELDLCS